MSKELDYIADLERENRLLGERCNQLLKDKGELTDKIADIKANCDLAIEGRDVKIKELELELTVEKDLHREETNLHLHAEDYIKSLEQQIEKMKTIIKKKYCKKCPYRKDNEMFLKIAYDENKKLKEQIEKMKCCGNCRFDYCERSSECIDKDGNRTFHCWNEEKERYCDVGKEGKYQCWEIKENGN